MATAAAAAAVAATRLRAGNQPNFGGILPGGGPVLRTLQVDIRRGSFWEVQVPHGAPRTAFAEQPAQMATPRPQQQRLGRASLVGACAVEAAVVVPTLHVEAVLAKEPWSLLLRIIIAAVRLSPIAAPCLAPLGRSAHRYAMNVPGHLGFLLQRLAALIGTVLAVLFCPEVRWGVAITLDMWYLLTTPLNKGLAEMPFVILLVANIILCFVDTLTLIMMLAVKNGEELTEQVVEHEAVARPRPLKLGNPEDEEEALATFDPTCIICLSDFTFDDDIAQLPCGHAFHTECIGKWLSRSRRCPLRCPQVVLPPLVTRTPVEAVLLPADAPAPGSEG